MKTFWLILALLGAIVLVMWRQHQPAHPDSRLQSSFEAGSASAAARSEAPDPSEVSSSNAMIPAGGSQAAQMLLNDDLAHRQPESKAVPTQNKSTKGQDKNDQSVAVSQDTHAGGAGDDGPAPGELAANAPLSVAGGDHDGTDSPASSSSASSPAAAAELTSPTSSSAAASHTEAGIQKTPDTDAPKVQIDYSKPVTVLSKQVVKKADGSLVLDGRYTLKGAGTEDDPYQVSWNLLASAEILYDPQSGKNELPQRVTMLEGKWIQVECHLVLPTGWAEEGRRIGAALAVDRVWDGGGIDQPPSVFSVIEVTMAPLTTAASDTARYAAKQVMVKGRFEIEPYLSGSYLLGLYEMADASLIDRGSESSGDAGR